MAMHRGGGVQQGLDEVTTEDTRRAGLTGVVGRLATMNAGVALVGILTGPLLARALGPSGRGDLAAVMAPLSLIPTLASLGLGSYAIRAAARGRPTGILLGSLMPAILLVSLTIVAASPLIAEFFAGGRDRVELLLTIGIMLTPIGMVSALLVDIAIGQERWRQVVLNRVIPPALMLAGVPVLFALDRLTVTTASALSFSAVLLTILPQLPVLREGWPPRFQLGVLREGLVFGLKSWLGGLTLLMNARLDQLLMIRLVPARELGLYVIALTLAQFFVNAVVGAVTVAASARQSRGEEELTRRLARMSIAGALAAAVVVGLISPLVLRILFGSEFMGALPMTLILLVANIPGAGQLVLSSALSSHGRPGTSTWGQVIALGLTVPGLLIVLDPLGGIGAALVSLAAYTVAFAFLLLHARRAFGGRWREYLIVDRDDIRALRDIVATRISGARTRLRARHAR